MRFVHSRLALFIFLATAKQIAVTMELGGAIRGLRFTLASLGAILVGTALAAGTEGLRQRLRLLAVDLFVSSLALIDLLHHRAFGDVPSVASLRYAGQLADVAAATADLLRPTDLLLFVSFPLLLWPSTFPRISRKATVALALIGLTLMGATFANSKARRRRFIGNAFSAADMGVVSYHLFDLYTYGKRLTGRMQGREEAAARVRGWLDARQQAPLSALHGAAAESNVLVLQLESFQSVAAGRSILGQPITPNLDRLAGESLHFSRFFEQAAAGRTSDAQFVANCSLFPSPDAAIAFEFASNDFRCLPTLLREEGYHTALFQPLAPRIWNSATFDPRLGFAQVSSQRDFVIDERFGMGLSDGSFFRQLAGKIEELPEPWYAYALSISSHAPFDDPRLPRTLEVGELEGTRVGAYLQTVHYTDQQLGKLLGRLEESGILDRTTLVVFGDHDGVTRQIANLDDWVDHGEDEYAWFVAEQQVPLLIRLPGGAHAEVLDGVGGQIDLAPTLADLLGVQTGDAAFLGGSLLDPAGDEPSVAFADGSILSAERLVVPRKAQCLAPGRRLRADACESLATRWRQALEVSELILEKNLVPLLGERPIPVAAGP